jgi:hypothetical protein
MNAKTVWQSYCTTELELLRPILSRRGYTLNDTQPHLTGERYLMQAVTTTSGKKLIMLGKKADGTPVVIKATRDEAGKRELAHEQACRAVLKKIDFAGEIFHTPELIEHITEAGFVVVVTRFIEQASTFTERPLKEQFNLALAAFKGQESAHATTFNHRALIAHTFGMRDAQTYLNTFSNFVTNITTTLPEETGLKTNLETARTILEKNKTIIEQYCGFLTHTDFVPHNIRIEGDKIILLDHSSLTFGNKYEGWARFLNFMTLYNQPLERALTLYVRNNRTPEESVALQMMRVYRLGEIIWYYVRTLRASSDDLLALNTARVHFWSDVLSYIMKNEEVPITLMETYKTTRDSLRSEDEKKRQVGLH